MCWRKNVTGRKGIVTGKIAMEKGITDPWDGIGPREVNEMSPRRPYYPLGPEKDSPSGAAETRKRGHTSESAAADDTVVTSPEAG
jgi:hypothetical protein